MKKIIAALLITTLLSCGDNTNEKGTITSAAADSLATENAKLKEEANQKEEAINSFMESFNDIQENLNVIKEKQKIITSSAKSGDVQNRKDQIVQDIQAINELMDQNRQKLTNMSGKLKKANLKIAELENMIATLTTQLGERDVEIIDLKDQLEKVNLHVAHLTTTIEESESASTEKTNKLNTAYYAMGTKKELEKQGVISKEGGLIGIGKTAQLKGDFNKNYFTKVDIRDVSSIPILSKKVKLVTSHPSGSYKLEGDPKKQIEKITITNPEEFWASSKYLVIITE